MIDSGQAHDFNHQRAPCCAAGNLPLKPSSAAGNAGVTPPPLPLPYKRGFSFPGPFWQVHPPFAFTPRLHLPTSSFRFHFQSTLCHPPSLLLTSVHPGLSLLAGQAADQPRSLASFSIIPTQSTMLACLNLKCLVAITLAWASISFASSSIEPSAELVKRASPHGVGRRSVDVGSALRFHRRRRRSTDLPAPVGTTRAKGMTQADNIALLAKFQAELVSMNEEVSGCRCNLIMSLSCHSCRHHPLVAACGQ